VSAGRESAAEFGPGAPVVADSGKTLRAWTFRAVLHFLRKDYRKVLLRQDTETMRALENAVRISAGTPIAKFRQPQGAMIKADCFDSAINPKLADFCGHYGMTPIPCRSYTPKLKGKVERGVGYPLAKTNLTLIS